LFHAILSYCGKFNISINACREMMPDPAFYAQCLRESFNELHEATVPKKTKAVAKTRAVAKKKVRKKTTSNNKVSSK
jgi:diacylglycerol O-acyltransferase